jgi:hypothetical protein
LVNGVAHYQSARNPKSLVTDNQRFADGYTGRDGNSLKRLHLSRQRPNRDPDRAKRISASGAIDR